jgi:hypothetical protein
VPAHDKASHLNASRGAVRLRGFLFILGVLTLGITVSAQTIDPALLKGAWSSDGQNFTFVIQERTILFEFDMKEHPYRLEANVIIIDFEDPTLGVQRKRILRLTDTELEIRDEVFDATEVLTRMKP